MAPRILLVRLQKHRAPRFPEASVQVSNMCRPVLRRPLMSDRQGRYRAPELSVDYEVRVSNAGSDTVVYKGKALAVGLQSAADFSLAVGRQTQTVVVQAQVSQVETTQPRFRYPHVQAADAWN